MSRRRGTRVAEPAASLERERERLAIALRAAHLGVYEWRIPESAVWWSPEVYEIYGVDPLMFVPTVEACTALIHPDDREEVWRKSQDCIERGVGLTHEYRAVRPDGEVRWIGNDADVALDPDGRVERVIGVAFDVTHRRQDEQRVGILISRIDDHLVTYDRQWRYTFVNGAEARVVGMSREELLGRSIWELFPDAVGNQYFRAAYRCR
ncbi:MAG: PAS domain-containing protein [Cytophagaceae bacterium]|nr:PAS domain-containing protein [Gemmatimonadaceae bacterium]